MKKLLLTIAATLLTVGVFAQGTVTFNNTGFNKISLGQAGSTSATWTVMPTTLQAFRFGLFYGIGQSTSLTFATDFGVNSTGTAGIIALPSNNTGTITGFQIPGTSPNETDVWVQIVGYNYSFGTDWAAAKAAAANDPTHSMYFGQTTVINCLALGPSTGPGATLWQLATGTDPRKFPGGGIPLFTGVIPEPSSMALAGLGAAALLIFRRRK